MKNVPDLWLWTKMWCRPLIEKFESPWYVWFRAKHPTSDRVNSGWTLNIVVQFWHDYFLVSWKPISKVVTGLMHVTHTLNRDCIRCHVTVVKHVKSAWSVPLWVYRMWGIKGEQIAARSATAARQTLAIEHYIIKKDWLVKLDHCHKSLHLPADEAERHSEVSIRAAEVTLTDRDVEASLILGLVTSILEIPFFSLHSLILTEVEERWWVMWQCPNQGFTWWRDSDADQYWANADT